MTKKLFTLLLAVAASIGTMFAWDYERVQIGDLYYNLDATNQTAEVTSQSSSYPYWSTTITTANIPASVEYNSVTYNVTSIGTEAFDYCTRLTSVTIPNSVTSIGDRAFGWCPGLTSIDVASDNSNYCSVDGVLFNKDKTTLIRYPGSKQGAYTIPNSVTSIGDRAFNYCTGLTSVTIPNSVTSIGTYAFYYCFLLTSVTIPNSVTSIGSSAFEDCIGLTSVTIPNSVTSIGEAAFRDCTGLTSVEIPNSVTSIGEGAFRDCTGLTSVTIGNGVTSIGDYAFGGCSSLPVVDNLRYADTYLVEAVDKTLSSYTIKDGTRLIGDYAFGWCTGLTSVTIPNSVISIGNNAFSNCSSLTSVTIPNSVTSIGEYAFYECTGLTSVTIPNSVTSIGEYAFYECTGLTSIYVPCGEMERFKQLLNNDSRVKYAPVPYSITINAENGSVTYPQTMCDDMQLTATPNYGYHFVKWSDGNTDNPRTFVVTQDTTFTAEFAPNKYNVSIIYDQEKGAIEGESGEFDYLTRLTYRAVAKYGYHLDHWNVINEYILDNTQLEDSENNLLWDYTKSAPQNNPDRGLYYASKVNDSNLKGIKLNSSGYCSFTKNAVAGILKLTFGPRYSGGCSLRVENRDGESVSLITTTEYVYTLTTVSIPLTEKQNDIYIKRSAENETVLQKIQFIETLKTYAKEDTVSIVVVGDTAIQAFFAKNSYQIIDNTKTQEGYISGAGYYSYYDTVRLTAIPHSGYHFTQWSDSVTDNPRIIVLTQDTTFTAEFAKNSYAISTISVNPEWGTTAGDTAALYLDEVEISAIPNYGYHFVRWNDYNTSNPRMVSVTEDKTYTATFAKNIYSITKNAEHGTISGNSSAEYLDEVTLSVSSDYGYHFAQWSDGNTDNPRTITLTSDTTFTAQFVKNSYTISTNSANPEWGTTAGDTAALYLDEVEISAIPNYGYHFVRWNDYNTSNPRTVSVTEDKTYTATFAKNVYSITKNAEHGTISGNSSSEYLDFVTLTVTPDYGYHFTQWSDGLKDNPRIAQITQDTTFTAEFAYDRVGTCGKDLALVWSYDPTNKVLTIGNAGSFTENMQFGVEAPNEMEELVIGNSVTAIGANAFAGIETLKKVSIGESVKTIGEQAFYNCVNLETIFNYRPTPTNTYSNAFDGVDKFECVLYVLPNSIDMYKAAAVWRDFYYTYAIGAEETTVATNDVTVEPQNNAATLTWPTSNNAASYTIQITKDGVVFCTLIFNGNGQLTGIAFAPSRDGSRHAPSALMTANGLQFTVTGLDSGTRYGYSVTAKDANDQPVATYSGEFTTTSEVPTSVDQVPSDQVQCTKVLRDGQIFILRGEKTYTVTGQETK